MRRRLMVLVVTAMMLAMMAAAPAMADPGGQGEGLGRGVGGGNFLNPDNGQRNAFGGGQLNNPNCRGQPGCDPIGGGQLNNPNPNAARGIATAVANTTKHGECPVWAAIPWCP